MIVVPWVVGQLRRRPGRMVATATGVAVAVALVGSLAAFVANAKATMTGRSIDNVAVDWQVQATGSTNGAQLERAVTADHDVVDALPVEFARVAGFASRSAAGSHTTGAGILLGFPDHYRSAFPGVLRGLVGRTEGVLVAQQTAANLGVGPGDTVRVDRSPLSPVRLRVDGIVDLPTADSLFQVVGAPAGAGPSAPPDNVLIVPAPVWHHLFDGLAARRPDLVTTQVHARIDHSLPADPARAYSAVVGRAHHLEVQLAGAGTVGDNLAATLASAREDALYAQVLFLFLGLPGAVLAALLTVAIAATGRDRRRREQALLRTRGATTAVLVRLTIAEAATVGGIGVAVGLVAARVVGSLALGGTGFGTDTAARVGWVAAGAAVGLLIALLAVIVPAWTDARRLSVTAARRRVDRARTPRWARAGLDFWLLGAGALLVWSTTRNGYHLVLAPEGVPTISVNYWAFAVPALLWAGGALFMWRIAELLLHYGRRPIGALAHPVAGPLADSVAAGMQRQRRLLARGVALVGVTAAFAASTAVFDATYRQQVGVDAVLTNGGDVTVTEPATASVGPELARKIMQVPGVANVEPVQHRFAYVGADLQDLYGVDPATVVGAAKLQDAYFQGGSARGLMRLLAQRPDDLLVSAETVHDYQLHPGDLLTLRLQDKRSGAYRPVRFHYVAVGKEFPTAPRDSFLVANRDYIAAQTHSPAVSLFLVDTSGRAPAAVADTLRRQMGARATVSDIDHTRRVIASSLTAVDLAGLTRVELGFALVLGAAAAGLVLWLGFAERRRSYAILNALGARPRQLGAFVGSEAVYVLGVGLAVGAVLGALLSRVLVRILTGVFDPPPASLSVPWAYLLAAAAVGTLAVVVASLLALRAAATPRLSALREV